MCATVYFDLRADRSSVSSRHPNDIFRTVSIKIWIDFGILNYSNVQLRPVVLLLVEFYPKVLSSFKIKSQATRGSCVIKYYFLSLI